MQQRNKLFTAVQYFGCCFGVSCDLFQVFSRVRIALFAGSGSKSLAPVSNLNFSHIMFCASFKVVLFFVPKLLIALLRKAEFKRHSREFFATCIGANPKGIRWWYLILCLCDCLKSFVDWPHK